MRNNIIKNSILVNAYNRIDELKNCLNHIFNAENIDDFNIVITYQSEVQVITEFIEGFNNVNVIKLPFDGKKNGAIENINFNRVNGLKYCFNILKSEYVIAVEDDINIGNDTLKFCDFIYSRFKNDINFRGINLCSNLPFSNIKKNVYGKFRYGLSGQCSLISLNTWNGIMKRNILFLTNSIGFDSQIELFLKTGFMVHPYNSRYIDNGWNGTHAPRDSKNMYYQLLLQSWTGPDKLNISSYEEEVFDIKWRKDCVTFNRMHNIIYLLRFYLYKIKLMLYLLLK
jgi:hypothetical protein